MTKITKETMLSALQKNFPEITDIIRNKGYKIQDTEYPPNITVYFTSSIKKKEHTWNYSITFSLSNNSIPYDTEDQEKIIKELPQLIKDETEKHMEFLKTPAGKKQLLDEKVIQFANDTAIKQDEHGIYRSGDKTDIIVIEAINGKKDLKKFHASGDLLALVRIDRTRTYSRTYMRNYGPATRTDKYLIGQNETGTRFAHQVHDTCESIEEAIKWIWQDFNITARHGDVGITPVDLNFKDTGSPLENMQIIDSHKYSGLFLKKGKIFYVRSGRITHDKNQHPDIEVPDSWHRIIIARRAQKGMRGTKD